MTFRFLALAATALLLFPACDSNTPEEPEGAIRAAYVGNAGNFAENNGSLTRYVIEDGTTSTPLTADALGGLVQNVVPDGYGNLFVLLNFSDSFDTGRGRIDRFSLDEQTRTRQKDVSVPRGFGVATEASDGSGGYVVAYWTTNLYDGTATRVSGASDDLVVPVGNNPEGLAIVGDRVYVANSGFGFGTSLSVLDRTTGADLGTIENVCTGPRTLLADGDGEVWVVCTGASDFNTGEVTAPGEIVVLNGATGAESSRVTFDGQTLGSATLGQDAAYSAEAQRLFVIGNGGVMPFDTRTNNPLGPIVIEGAVGAVGYDADASRLYVGRPNAASPFGADGFVTIHSADGTEVNRFTAGIAPVAIVFGDTTRPAVVVRAKV